KGEILLLKVNKEKIKEFEGEAYWDIPGGRIHRGSTIEETLRREVEEETGIVDIQSIEPFTMTLSNIRIPYMDSDTGLILSIYSCEVGDTDKITLSNEHSEYKWTNSKEASKLLEVKYPKEFTEKIR
ncbi:MAG: NUDIX hydrolase, partial [Candidatus Paceibacterota bacterium]